MYMQSHTARHILADKLILAHIHVTDMFCTYADTPESIRSAVRGVSSRDDVAGVLLCVTPTDGVVDWLDPFVQTLDVTIFGGLFPEIIYGGENKDHGAVICGLTSEPDVTTVPELSAPDKDYVAQLDAELPLRGYETAFVFVDAYSTNIQQFVESLFRTYSVELNYIGGGAGTLEMEQRPCLFTNEGVIEDSAVFAAVEAPVALGVKHGWREIAGPFRVTDADGTTLWGLDGRPAFSVYKSAVEEHSETELTAAEFFQTAKAYPFGIARLDGEQIVRDPFEVTDGDGLSCFGDVPEGEFVHVLEGEPESLIDAARSAGKEARESDMTAEGLFFFDCISRVLYLEDEFERELSAVEVEGTPMVGALTIGEIANDGYGHLDYYNKTAVVAAVKDL